MFNTVNLAETTAQSAPTFRDQQEELVFKLAQNLSACAPRGGDFPIRARLKKLTEFFQSAYRYFDEAARTQVSVSHTAEWLLDNFHVIEQTIRQVEEDMPADYYHRLPKTNDGFARIYILALAIGQRENIHYDIDQIENFTQIFQSITPLKIGELWALPPMLRLAIMETLADGLAEGANLDWDAAPQPDLLREARDFASDSPQPATETMIVNCILNLRLLGTQDWKAFFEFTSIPEKILNDDPAGMYAHMDFETRNRYRNIIEELASGSPMDEVDVASQAIKLAQAGISQRERHVGYYLIGSERIILEAQIAYRPTLNRLIRRWIKKNATLVYLGSIGVLTALIYSAIISYALDVGGYPAQIILVALLSLLPASAMTIELINWLVISIIPPRVLPKLDFQTGVPSEYSTMVVIPALLSTEKDAPFLTRQLENHFLGNADRNIHFALLTDFADAPQKEMTGDQQNVEQAKAAIELLNKKYGDENYLPFYLFHRERIWNPGEARWMGWERKRGKLEEFNKLLRGSDSTTYIVRVGDQSILSNIRYVITLDADTQLPRDSAHRLIGALAHPRNRAEFDQATGEIKAGYSVLQPRTQVRPVAANQSLFTRIYSGDTVVDLYTHAISDVYQDLFGEGNYVGKGIYDVDAFQYSLQDRIPDNSLLSHDLFEGIQGRCGLVTDVTLFEDYPPYYLAYTDRLHRWVRGDWQLLRWLGTYVPHCTKGRVPNPLSLIDRWKIFDNLRRSLMPIAIIGLLGAGWFLLPGANIVWVILALSPFLISMVTNLISALLNMKIGQSSRMITQPLRLSTLRLLFAIIFLPHETLIMLDAIATTLARMFITHKKMLQWKTAAHTVQFFGKRVDAKIAWREMVLAPLSAFALSLLLLALSPQSFFSASPLLIGWMVAPYIATRIGKPFTHSVKRLLPAQERKLRLLARSTWLYFERFVDPTDRWLPPDHFQESPRGSVAHRTSPTNIGLMLLSMLSAQDLGYIGPQEFSVRLRDVFDSLDSLERVRGHFLNWYDTRTLASLSPRYISTVDNGNLAACLLTLRQGCREMDRNPVVQWEGLLDTLNMLSHTLEQSQLGNAANELRGVIDATYIQVETLSDTRQFSPSLLNRLFHDSYSEMENMLLDAVQRSSEEIAPKVLNGLSVWIERIRYHLKHVENDLQALTPWLLKISDAPSLFSQPDINPDLAIAWKSLSAALSFCPSLGQISKICRQAGVILKQIIDLLDESDKDALDWCNALVHKLESAGDNSVSLLDDYSALASRAESYFQEMNFSFLFDYKRQVFHIGYNVETNHLDPNYYDLMASEARITSLVAIARGDVPQNHWLYLGRPLTQVGDKRVLLSWSGTMFEYLMPTLLVESYPNTLLDQSCCAAVEEQIRYATRKNVPWGISESSYYAFDSAQTYQYQAFGAPSLGYKRGLSDDLVIAPYASILALPFAPQAVMQNLTWFEKNKMWSLYGLYESVDFTDSHLKTGEDFAVIRSFMAHHQGMILLSLSNYLLNNRMIRRFHADARIESIELLLQEQTSLHAPTERSSLQQMDASRATYAAISLDPWHVSPDAAYTQLHCLSNGSYSLLITAAGGGFSRWGDIELTRWQPDSTLDDWGSWIYAEDRLYGQAWSVTRQPGMPAPDRSEVCFFPQKVEFMRQDEDVVLRTSVNIAPDDNVEIRHVTITNHGDYLRTFALTSYAEIILSSQAVDQHHPAFNKLFIESEFLPDEQLLLFRRRPRLTGEKPVYLAHFFTSDQEHVKLAGYETDRARFIGRGGTSRNPIVFSVASEASVLSGATGATLDPICALQAEIEMPPYETARIAFVTLAANSRKDAIELARRYRHWPQLNKAIDDARIQAEQELAQLELTSQDVEWIQKLLSPLLYPSPALRAEPAELSANTLSQSGLWSFGISGDYPILLVRLKREADLDLLNKLLLAHTYWRKRGLMIDLVILNQRDTSYEQDFHGKILRLLNRTDSDAWLNKHGGIFIVHEDQMNNAERILLAVVARVVLDGEAGALELQLAKLDIGTVCLPSFVPIESSVLNPDTSHGIERPANLLFDNGLGGFSPDGREYVIYLAPGQWTPAPWVNVIATPGFGFLVSEAGLGCTWSQNSGENRLTPWRNDPVSDRPSEAIYLRDEDTGQVWSPTPLPVRADAPYLIRHGAGYSIFEHASHGLEQNVRVFAVPNEPVKIIHLKLRNTTTHMRRISVTYYAEWVLGSFYENATPYIVPEFASNHYALLARNTYNHDFGQRVAFLASTREPSGVTTDRAEFLGHHGSYARPAALERVGLTSRIQPGAAPCAALQLLIWLQPGETKEVSFLFGQGADYTDTERLITHYQDIENIETAWQSVGEFWDKHLGQIQIKTPDAGMDLLLNRWLLYQSLASRFWGRMAFYQPGGAYGFRDQLQDVMAYIHVRPEMVRQHILDAASHQFEQGDVLHWWHPPVGRGVLTRCSDNLLWLPYVTAYYVRSTGDRSILDEKVPFLSAEPLKPGENERYGLFPSTDQVGTLYDHCCRALARGTTSGQHGIPLIGAHDWNDGMNRIGAQGQGESIWLGWFLYNTLNSFAGICELISDHNQADDYRGQADTIRDALESNGWDGNWYRRAYYDDGSPLGSDSNNECKIDSIAQSWAVISKGADSARASRAMESVYERLIRLDDKLMLLFAPPFDRTARDPGYIKGYPPGIRENGGQYSHASIWAIWAFAELGQGDRAVDLFHLINPIYHADTREKVNRYVVEPYVIAADVCSTPPHVGRGGWTW
ncbi:MAG: hypothetical protein MUO77_11945, partial [Anaerolineales bacterium]|nr:hypothetical protein [Anaerolineales bacterium]